jgi:hypothetical protein
MRIWRFLRLLWSYEKHRRGFGSRFPEAKFNTFRESLAIHWRNSRYSDV